jgi:hypothetical protein
MRQIACALVLLFCACKSPLWVGKSGTCHSNSDCAADAYCNSGVCASTSSGLAMDLGGACVTSADCPAGVIDGCGQTCPDGTNPCAIDCVSGQCLQHGCPKLGDGGSSNGDGAPSGSCTNDCDCDPVHSVGCQGGRCAAVARLLVCCGIPNPPGWVKCLSDGGTAVSSCVQAGGQCEELGAALCPPSKYACDPGLCCNIGK